MMKLGLVTLLVLAACGNKKKDAPPAPAAAAAPAVPVSKGGDALGKCSLTVTGDVTLNDEGIAKTPPNSAAMAATDYWMTDAEIRAGLETLAGLDQRKSKQQAADEAEQGMKKDPRVMLLAINCGGDLIHVDFGPGKDSKYADIPMKPGKYVIASEAKAGQLGALIHLEGKHPHFSISEPGTLELTKFDLTGIAGTFAFKAKSSDDKQAIEVHGSFDYPCVGQACKK